ncbi:hypothetical protein [Thermoactinospora rubra]|uniref:hypothetical protein n=1 Tax=Thermoactinospora rubra TaxID=1088767 RepID=UPI00146FA299|nr:hypothetical protein [Thermoactinospora rubra]
MLDQILHAFVTVSALSSHPIILVILGFVGAYLGGKLVEIIPATRRIIERREAQAAERQ